MSFKFLFVVYSKLNDFTAEENTYYELSYCFTQGCHSVKEKISCVFISKAENV